jgi:hypothetical protein
MNKIEGYLKMSKLAEIFTTIWAVFIVLGRPVVIPSQRIYRVNTVHILEFSPVCLDSLNEALLQEVWLVMILQLVSLGDVT